MLGPRCPHRQHSAVRREGFGGDAAPRGVLLPLRVEAREAEAVVLFVNTFGAVGSNALIVVAIFFCRFILITLFAFAVGAVDVPFAGFVDEENAPACTHVAPAPDAVAGAVVRFVVLTLAGGACGGLGGAEAAVAVAVPVIIRCIERDTTVGDGEAVEGRCRSAAAAGSSSSFCALLVVGITVALSVAARRPLTVGVSCVGAVVEKAHVTVAVREGEDESAAALAARSRHRWAAAILLLLLIIVG